MEENKVINVFSQTSNEPYDKHTYEIFLFDGKKIKFDFYDDMRYYWFQHSQLPNYLNYCIVKDKKPTKGFGTRDS